MSSNDPQQSGEQSAPGSHEPGDQGAAGQYEPGEQGEAGQYESGDPGASGTQVSGEERASDGAAAQPASTSGVEAEPSSTSPEGGANSPWSSPAPADQSWPWAEVSGGSAAHSEFYVRASANSGHYLDAAGAGQPYSQAAGPGQHFDAASGAGQHYDPASGAGQQYPAPGPGQHYQAYDYAMGRAVEPQPSAAYPADPGGYPPASGSDPGTAAGQGSSRPQGRASWVALVGAAVLAAGLASGGTAALLNLSDDEPAAEDQASDDSSAQSIPVVAAADGTPDWEGVAEAVRPAVVAIDVAGRGGSGAGSGMVWDDEGHIVTNNHVVAGAEQIVVTLADGRMFEAEIVGADPITDLAVLALADPPDDLDLPVIGDAADQQVGRPVMAVGNPLGLSSTVTTGIISALDRPVTAGEGQGQAPTVTNAIQIDAAINPGNSGGPLFDAEGRAIGITSAIASLSGGQSGNIGLGFAIPMDLVTTITEQLIESGTAEHAFLGVALSEDTVTADGVTRSGASVQSIESGSPADEAGLAVGDVITAIDDRPVSSAAALTGYVRAHTAGEKVNLAVVREGELTDVEVTLATTSEQTS